MQDRQPKIAVIRTVGRISTLRKNSGFDSALKGRGFQPRRECRKINDGFSR
jgi:hypothetical protein